MTQTHSIEVTHIFVADGHNFYKSSEKDPDKYPAVDLEEAEVVQDAGLRGDRYYTPDAGFTKQVTFFQEEVHDELVEKFGLSGLSPDRYRRNICVRGFDVHLLVGKEFAIGGVRFRGVEIAEPCKWMDVSVHPGAKEFLKGRGGIRAQVLSTGRLRKGHTSLCIEESPSLRL